MQKSKTLFWGLIILVVLVLIILYAGRDSADVQLNDRGETVEQLADGQEKTTAEEGDVVSSFPQELLLFDDSEVTNSYSIAYDREGVRQPVVEFSVNVPLGEVAEQYRQYLIEENWTITSDLLADDGTSAFLYAKKDGRDISINLTPVGETTEVVVAYVERQQ